MKTARPCLKTSGDEIPLRQVSDALFLSACVVKLIWTFTATARFRIKKKQRSLNLERSVSDLAGRAEELEREASELRRENGWLKEIVMLKGRSLSGAGERSRASRGDKDSDSEDQSEESEAGEASAASKKKGKGKGRDKSNK